MVPDFLDRYIDFMLKDATRSGATAAELAVALVSAMVLRKKARVEAT